MSDGNNKVKFEFDIDAKELLEKLLTIREEIEGLSEPKNLSGLIDGLLEAKNKIAILGTAALAAKVIIESTFDAEKIKQVNIQFESLAASAGLVAENLKEGLIASSKGLADDTDILKAANKAIVEFGDSAGKLPELMELARKSTAIYGGELTDRFEALNHAIATGSQKALKQLGLQVDVNKAYEKYAESLNLTSGQLSEAAKKQALMNEVLETGKSKFKNVNESVLEANNTWKQLTITLKNIQEVVALFIDSLFGDTVRKGLKTLNSGFKDLKDIIVSTFGDGTEKASASINRLEKEYSDLFIRLTEIEKEKKSFWSFFTDDKKAAESTAAIKKRMEDITIELKRQRNEIELTHEEQKKFAEEEKGPATPQADTKKVLQDKAKFEADLLKLHEESLKLQNDATKAWVEKERISLEQLTIENEKYNQRKDQINSNADLNKKQKQELLLAEEQAHQEKLIALEVQRTEAKKKSIDDQMRMTQDLAAFDQMMEMQKEAARINKEQQEQMILENKKMTEEQRRQAQLEIEMQYQAQITQIQMNAQAEREQMLQRWVYSSNNAAEQFAKGFASASMRAQGELMNFGKQGQMVFNSLQMHAGNAFMKLGEGAEKGSDIMKGALLGMIADVAQNYGQMMLAAGIFPPNPAVLAAGAGLLVLAGYLRSQAKGKSSASSYGGGSISGTGEIGGVASSFSPTEQVKENQRQAKSVHLEVHGNIFDSDQSRQRITELVRQSIDSTDFSISRVGGGL